MVKSNGIAGIVIGALCVIGLTSFVLLNAKNISDNAKAIGNIEGDMKVVRYILEHQSPELAEEARVNNIGNHVEVPDTTSEDTD